MYACFKIEKRGKWRAETWKLAGRNKIFDGPRVSILELLPLVQTSPKDAINSLKE